jgi:peptidylprolyl isomerase
MKKRNVFILTAIFLILSILAIIMVMQDKETIVVMQTNHGDIKIKLYSDMPITTKNFLDLVNKGFYNGLSFHRLIPEFMIQGGCPRGDGTGGPGYKIKDEFTHKGGNKNNRGTISMANAGPNTGGSQFFINVVDNNYLDSMHPAFGEVIEGMEIVDEISNLPTDYTDKPIKPVIISKISVL